MPYYVLIPILLTWRREMRRDVSILHIFLWSPISMGIFFFFKFPSLCSYVPQNLLRCTATSMRYDPFPYTTYEVHHRSGLPNPSARLCVVLIRPAVRPLLSLQWVVLTLTPQCPPPPGMAAPHAIRPSILQPPLFGSSILWDPNKLPIQKRAEGKMAICCYPFAGHILASTIYSDYNKASGKSQ